MGLCYHSFPVGARETDVDFPPEHARYSDREITYDHTETKLGNSACHRLHSEPGAIRRGDFLASRDNRLADGLAILGDYYCESDRQLGLSQIRKPGTDRASAAVRHGHLFQPFCRLSVL